MAQFTGLSDEERTTLKTLRQTMQTASEAMRAARQAFDAYNEQLRAKYDLTEKDQILDVTEQERQAAAATKVSESHAALDLAMQNASVAEKAKYDAWVAAGRPVPKKFLPNEG